MLDQAIKPSSIVAYLDEFVIGQDEAKKILAVAVYSHYRKIEQARRDSVEIAKSNVLLIGPRAPARRSCARRFRAFCKVPFVTADATSLAQTRCVNEEIEAILQRLVDKADGDLARAQTRHRLHRRDRQAQGAAGPAPQHLRAKACSTRC